MQPSDTYKSLENDVGDLNLKSQLLINDAEVLQYDSADSLCFALNCPAEEHVKVVSIFGKTGDGKSHTLNNVFFDGREVFATSSKPDSCTAGVWAAHDAERKALVLDTEGLQGLVANENQRTRLLLKILAVSDVIIYRTKTDRLQSDMFAFLSDASKAYSEHFKNELTRAVSKDKSVGIIDAAASSLGPIVLVFHETQHTEVLSGDDQLMLRFSQQKQSCDAFASIQYVGINSRGKCTNFESLKKSINKALIKNDVRSARSVRVVFQLLQALNDKFSGSISDLQRPIFPDEYFTCGCLCMCCKVKCTLTMQHTGDHCAPDGSFCRYVAEYDNKVYLCKVCLMAGRRSEVSFQIGNKNDPSLISFAKYAWSGYVLECKNCGTIHNSRKYWYGNEDPEKAKAVQSEVRHLWEDADVMGGAQSSMNAAQRMLDSMNNAFATVNSVTTSVLPTELISDYISDSIAPSHWIPNTSIRQCNSCQCELLQSAEKHHCRSCGKGFCDACSQDRAYVCGYGDSKVRVCKHCAGTAQSAPTSVIHNDTLLRQYSEIVSSTWSSVCGTAASKIKDYARPTYWQPDEEAENCCECKEPFSLRRTIHHCRRCGLAVCATCSTKRQPVPARGWDEPVRVCDKCFEKK